MSNISGVRIFGGRIGSIVDEDVLASDVDEGVLLERMNQFRSGRTEVKKGEENASDR
jgi:hypothetical protein